MKKRVKGICTLLLAGALAATLLPGLPSARAAVAVDTSKEDCQLEISVGSNIGTTYKDLMELRTEDVRVDLYKVAEIDESGAYTAIGDFSDLNFGYIEYNSEGTTTADAWNARAEEAAEKVTEDTAKAATLTIPAGQTSATQTGLDVGLYLIMPETLTTDYFTYTFAPSLVSLPNNYYYTTGNDEWQYDLTGSLAITLKPEQTERLGSLDITKDLSSWVQTAGSKTTFVFEITYTTPKGETQTRQEALTFEGAGTKTLTITDIPAGSEVTVTEIYSGAAYTVSGDATVETTVVADDEEGNSQTGSVTITNTPGNTPNGGSGVVNHFQKDSTGEYQWTKEESSDGGSAAAKNWQTKTTTDQTQAAE